MIDGMITDEGPDSKVQVQALLGACYLAVAFTVCWLCGKDPWGGASLSLHSLQSAALGAALSAPLALFRWWTWTGDAYQRVGAMDDMHRALMEQSRPWLSGLGKQHVAVILAAEVLPVLFLLLPAAQGGITLSLGMYSELLTNVAGLELPEGVGAALALLFTAAVAGVGKAHEINVSTEQYSRVKTAVDNADRFYRVMAMDVHARGQSADQASLAFKAVSVAWLRSKEAAAQLAGAIAFFDVIWYGTIWYCTQDLTAPAVAALLVQSVDYNNMHEAVHRKKTVHGNKGARGSRQ